MKLIYLQGGDQKRFFEEFKDPIIENDEVGLSTLNPEDFSSLQAAMKSLIEGFIKRDDTSEFQGLQMSLVNP